MLRKDLPIRSDLMDGSIAGYNGNITVYANPIVSKIRSDLLGDGGITIPEPLPDVPWTPLYITTSLWLDAAETSSLVLDGSGNVSQWLDLSGNNRHCVQGNSSLRPLYLNNGLNSLDSVRFTSDFLDNTGSINLPSYTVALLAQINVNPPAQPVNYPVGFGGANGLAWGGSDSSINNKILGFGPVIPSTYTPVISTPAIVTFVCDNINASVFVNGGNSGTGTYSVDVTQIRLGYRTDNFWFFNGDISDLVITPNIDVGTRQKLEGYLAHKKNLESILVTGHPYKTNPPIEYRLH